MKKIKIAHMVVALDGGVGNVILNYFDHMPLEDYEVHILSHDVSSDLYRSHYEQRGFKVIELPKISNGLLKSIRYTRKVCEENQYDAAHCHQTLTSLFPLFAAKQAKIKTRISHSHLAIQPGTSLKDDILIFMNHHFSKFVATDCMACGTDAGLSNFGKQQPFMVLNNALELEQYRFDSEIREQERRKLGLENSFVIGHVGRFMPQKNHKFLIDAFKSLCKKTDCAKLLFVGEGDLMDEMRSYASSLGLADRIIFLGPINDVPRKMQAMDVFALPSIAEGLPVVALEAQAAGLPCIISDRVTGEAAVTPDVSYLSITQPGDEEKWAEKCLQYQNVQRSNDTISMLREHGYDISIEAKKLDLFYKEHVMRG